MIHPTRTQLLMLKDKQRSVSRSTAILKARRQALIREFLSASAPYLRSRLEIRKTYSRAIDELMISLGRQGMTAVRSLSASSGRDINVDIIEKNIWGLAYRDIRSAESPVRRPDERDYDVCQTSPHLEECIHLFEKLIEDMINIAEFESKVKVLAEEIARNTRRIRILEERILPLLGQTIRRISLYLGEREREEHYRLKQFKEGQERGD